MRPCECLGSVWSQRDRPGASGVAPTVRATVAQFNAVTGCVLGSVLAAPGLAAAQRAQRIEKWIRVAQVCGAARRGGEGEPVRGAGRGQGTSAEGAESRAGDGRGLRGGGDKRPRAGVMGREGWGQVPKEPG